MFQPAPVLHSGGNQGLPAPVELDLLWQEQVEQHHQADPQSAFQMHADDRQPFRRASVALQQYLQPLLSRLATQAFKLHHRHHKTAAQV
ncbi:hypothetical protein D3C80_1929900 [compost metagenome]